MDVAIIDWENVDSSFVEDDLYEHISAPQWIDFSDPGEPVDDEAWFCRSSCNHPKAAEDFFNQERVSPASNSRHQRSASVSDIPPLGDKMKRDGALKKRGANRPFLLPSNKDLMMKHYLANEEDAENQDPNYLSTPVNHKAKVGKEAIKSSAEKKLISDNVMTKNEPMPKLRSTLSARNLFSGGGDILNKVSEFCNDLKKLANRAREKENGDDEKNLVDENFNIVVNDNEKERKPLLATSKEKSGSVMGSIGGSRKGQLRRKKNYVDRENTPPLYVDANKKKHTDQEEALLNVRTCPPTPQCFSAGKGQFKGPTPKLFRTRTLNQERSKEMKKEINRDPVEKDARSLDVFWFFKPCTLSS